MYSLFLVKKLKFSLAFLHKTIVSLGRKELFEKQNICCMRSGQFT